MCRTIGSAHDLEEPYEYGYFELGQVAISRLIAPACFLRAMKPGEAVITSVMAWDHVATSAFTILVIVATVIFTRGYWPFWSLYEALWFASLDRNEKASVRAALAGESTELDLPCSRMTRIPEGVFSTLTVLTKLDLINCTSLTALPESLGQLWVLTTLDLIDCTSLTALPKSLGQLRALTTLNLDRCDSVAAESIKRGERLRKRNQRIRDGRALRFPMTTHDFAATVLFGSMLRRPRPSGDGGDAACSV